ncbi:MULTISPECIES: acetyl-CoA carboxylase [unclassified Haladaptatus]|uniref:acetyl-CoA carboxylase n=1 Tax=unclassified Haladaptatus TaxID=2622732 RepID=UPI0023E7DB0D|nr:MULTISPECIES: acetyl-CoA carboxylase [unclassified Haladaptatus]
MKETISAPMPGVFYRRSDPDDPPLVEEGDTVSAGDVVCLVGVMKNFYEVTAESDGTVSKILVENETEIEAGDPLIEIDVA